MEWIGTLKIGESKQLLENKQVSGRVDFSRIATGAKAFWQSFFGTSKRSSSALRKNQFDRQSDLCSSEPRAAANSNAAEGIQINISMPEKEGIKKDYLSSKDAEEKDPSLDLMHVISRWAEEEEENPTSKELYAVPRSPKPEEGIPFESSIPAILKTQSILILRMAKTLGLSETDFNRLVLQAVFRLAAYVELVPASRQHHHREAGGLFRHSLEVAFEAAQMSKGVIFSRSGSTEEIDAAKPRWALACFLAGLCHDVGKVESNFEVYDRSTGERWNPFTKSLWRWGIDKKVREYHVRWKPNVPHSEHEQLNAQLARAIIPDAALDFLHEIASEDIVQMLMKALSGFAAGNKIHEIMTAADMKSVRLYNQAHGYTGKAEGEARLDERFCAALRHRIQLGDFVTNVKSGQFWFIDGRCYLVWNTQVVDSIREALAALNLASIPNDLNVLAGALVDDGLLIPHEVNRNGQIFRSYIWYIMPKGVPKPIRVVLLKTSRVIMRMPPDNVDGKVVESPDDDLPVLAENEEVEENEKAEGNEPGDKAAPAPATPASSAEKSSSDKCQTATEDSEDSGDAQNSRDAAATSVSEVQNLQSDTSKVESSAASSVAAAPSSTSSTTSASSSKPAAGSSEKTALTNSAGSNGQADAAPSSSTSPSKRPDGKNASAQNQPQMSAQAFGNPAQSRLNQGVEEKSIAQSSRDVKPKASEHVSDNSQQTTSKTADAQNSRKMASGSSAASNPEPARKSAGKNVIKGGTAVKEEAASEADASQAAQNNEELPLDWKDFSVLYQLGRLRTATAEDYSVLQNEERRKLVMKLADLVPLAIPSQTVEEGQLITRRIRSTAVWLTPVLEMYAKLRKAHGLLPSPDQPCYELIPFWTAAAWLASNPTVQQGSGKETIATNAGAEPLVIVRADRVVVTDWKLAMVVVGGASSHVLSRLLHVADGQKRKSPRAAENETNGVRVLVHISGGDEENGGSGEVVESAESADSAVRVEIIDRLTALAVSVLAGLVPQNRLEATAKELFALINPTEEDASGFVHPSFAAEQKQSAEAKLRESGGYKRPRVEHVSTVLRSEDEVGDPDVDEAETGAAAGSGGLAESDVDTTVSQPDKTKSGKKTGSKPGAKTGSSGSSGQNFQNGIRSISSLTYVNEVLSDLIGQLKRGSGPWIDGVKRTEYEDIVEIEPYVFKNIAKQVNNTTLSWQLSRRVTSGEITDLRMATSRSDAKTRVLVWVKSLGRQG